MTEDRQRAAGTYTIDGGPEDVAAYIARCESAMSADTPKEKLVQCHVCVGEVASVIEGVLRKYIDLAKPDDLAFLEFQAGSIAREVASRLGLLRVPAGQREVLDSSALAFAAGRERGLEEAVTLCEKERVGALKHRAVQMAVGAVECRDAIHALRAT